jgi:hypothetical protein
MLEMTRADIERIAILEIEMKHLSDQFAEHRDESRKDAKAMAAAMKVMTDNMAAWNNQVNGGKKAIGLLMTLGAAFGSALTWLGINLEVLSRIFPR